MAATNDVKIRILVDGKEVDISLDELKKKMQGAGGAGSTAGTSIAGGMKIAYFGVMAAIGAVAGLVIGLGKAVNIASDMNEEVAKMNVVFAGASDKAFDFRDKLHDAYNMSYLEATKLMGRTGDLMTGFGATSDQAADLAFKVNSLSADLVSFKNVEGGVQSASDAITKAMMGERESAKQLGIVIRETDIQARLAADGKNKLTGNAKNLAIAETTLSIIYEQQKNAIGDLERTQDSYANQQRKARAAMEDIGMTIGSILLPLWGKLITAINDFLDWIKPERIAGVLNAAYEVIKTYVQQAIKQFETLNTVLKIMAIAVSEAIQGNFAGAAALTDAAVKYAADSIINMTNEISKAAARGYEEGVNNFHEFLKGMKQEAKESGNIADEMNLDDFKKELIEIKRQYDINKIGAQEYLDLLYEKLGENIKGSDKYLEIQKAINTVEDEQAKRREELQQKYYEDQKKFQDEYHEMKIQQAADEQQSLYDYLDALYETNQLSKNAYLFYLNERLLTIKAALGKESAEYILLSNKISITTHQMAIRLESELQPIFHGVFIDIFTKGEFSLNKFFKSFKNMLANMVAEIAAKSIAKKFSGFLEGVLGGLLGPILPFGEGGEFKGNGKILALQQGYEVTKPSLALIGERGEPEIVAPRKTFIDFIRKILSDEKARYQAQETAYKSKLSQTLSGSQDVINMMMNLWRKKYYAAKMEEQANPTRQPWEIALEEYQQKEKYGVGYEFIRGFASGGLITNPTLGILGESGPEIIAPKKNFIDITNELVNKGSLGNNNKELLSEMRSLNTNISNMKLEANIDSEKLAIIAEVGNRKLSYREY